MIFLSQSIRRVLRVVKCVQIMTRVGVFLCQAYMYLAGTDDVCSSAVPGSKSERKRIRVRPHDGYSVSWPIIPLQTGNFTIRVIARTSIGGDIVEKTLYVVVSGSSSSSSMFSAGHSFPRHSRTF